MTSEEAYEEALRRVRKAKGTGALELHLTDSLGTKSVPARVGTPHLAQGAFLLRLGAVLGYYV